MMRASADKVAVVGRAARIDMPHFRVGDAVDGPAIQHQPAADPGADGEIGQAANSPICRRKFRQRRRIHVGVKPHRRQFSTPQYKGGAVVLTRFADPPALA
jgi:hypothetical protein